MFEWNDGSYLAHYGIPGQKWGVRRFQNEDGSLTAAGKERYGVGDKMGKAERPSGYQRTPYRPHSRKVSKHLGGALPFKRGEDVGYGIYSVNPDDPSYMYDGAANYDELMDEQYIQEQLKDFEEQAKENPGAMAQLLSVYGMNKNEIMKWLEKYAREDYSPEVTAELDKELRKRASKHKVKDAHGIEAGADGNNKKKRRGIEQSLEKK